MTDFVNEFFMLTNNFKKVNIFKKLFQIWKMIKFSTKKKQKIFKEK